MLSPQFLDELRSRITLSSLISRSVKIQKAGREFKACCPFHNEKTPSFTINDEKGFYHCFGCGAHGDAIRWMTDQRGLGFMDAVKDLAAEAQMEVPAPDPRAAQRQEQRATLHDVMAAAQDWFVTQFNSIEGAQAREYLKNRGISEKTIREFGFGFAPNSRGKLKEALSGHGIDLLIEGGLLIKVDDKEPYDRFRGRLMIPIRDPRGRVIAFGGRILGDGEPKYLNSPDTPLFDKGRTLYNLDKASPASRQTGRILVVEGYMDAIALAQAGFEDVVAPLGTALTEHQIERIWKMVEAPILCFDGDNAGQKAAMRAAERTLPILRPGVSMEFLNLPDGTDPDDLLRTSGPDALQKLIDGKLSLDRKIWSTLRSNLGSDPGPDKRASLHEDLVRLADTIGHEVSRAEYKKSLRSAYYDEFGVGKKMRKKLEPIVSAALHDIENRMSQMMQRAVLHGLMRYPKVISSRFEELSSLKIENEFLRNWRDLLLYIGIDRPDISEDIFEELLINDGLKEVPKRSIQTDLRFSFYSFSPDDTKPINDLKAVIDAITQHYALEESLIAAKQNIPADYSDEDLKPANEIAEQSRQAKRKLYDIFEFADEFV